MDVTPTQARRARTCGFSLVELTSVLSVALILVGVGVPEYRHFSAQNQLHSNLQSFLTHLQMARISAIQQTDYAILCPSRDGINCLKSTEWHQGILLFLDRNRNKKADQGDLRLRVWQTPSNNPVRITTTSGRPLIRFDPNGWASGYNATITFCSSSAEIPPKALIFGNPGRIRISDKGPGGKKLTCN
ncbi:Tfp pilus assembly protein FimT [endosymbiont of Ridgeia piscesae]|jgi:type IV fimbrial biogenesis protein FimT|uniref:Type II secretion system protein H n=3 Tax=endosymbiont of Ridgeia piscesae TaxID=54398 RepID=A0A0T5YZ45_9GAMM|nr:GspH/FimT family pseudopilin [endosymbiont of Ridgeia piscesae]KRT55820.1 Tfp pilus assembly protein FimT [endosymbiont of Ridgeia piscesae]